MTVTIADLEKCEAQRREILSWLADVGPLEDSALCEELWFVRGNTGDVHLRDLQKLGLIRNLADDDLPLPDPVWKITRAGRRILEGLAR